jgi:hypothetical protein
MVPVYAYMRRILRYRIVHVRVPSDQSFKASYRPTCTLAAQCFCATVPEAQVLYRTGTVEPSGEMPGCLVPYGTVPVQVRAEIFMAYR